MRLVYAQAEIDKDADEAAGLRQIDGSLQRIPGGGAAPTLSAKARRAKTSICSRRLWLCSATASSESRISCADCWSGAVPLVRRMRV